MRLWQFTFTRLNLTIRRVRERAQEHGRCVTASILNQQTEIPLPGSPTGNELCEDHQKNHLPDFFVTSCRLRVYYFCLSTCVFMKWRSLAAFFFCPSDFLKLTHPSLKRATGSLFK